MRRLGQQTWGARGDSEQDGVLWVCSEREGAEGDDAIKEE